MEKNRTTIQTHLMAHDELDLEHPFIIEATKMLFIDPKEKINMLPDWTYDHAVKFKDMNLAFLVLNYDDLEERNKWKVFTFKNEATVNDLYAKAKNDGLLPG